MENRRDELDEMKRFEINRNSLYYNELLHMGFTVSSKSLLNSADLSIEIGQEIVSIYIKTSKSKNLAVKEPQRSFSICFFIVDEQDDYAVIQETLANHFYAVIPVTDLKAIKDNIQLLISFNSNPDLLDHTIEYFKLYDPVGMIQDLTGINEQEAFMVLDGHKSFADICKTDQGALLNCSVDRKSCEKVLKAMKK